MIHATKATQKRLQEVLAKASQKNYFTDAECDLHLISEWIKKANETKESYELEAKYGDVKTFDLGNYYYCIDGLCVKNPYDSITPNLYRLSIKNPTLVKYTNCLDLNYAIIYDVNKLVKLLITA